MAKGKGKPARLTVPHREAFERINFLLQVCRFRLMGPATCSWGVGAVAGG
jgi:hypothetical protein